MKKNYKLINIEVDGIDYSDYPDFVDAYITYAEHENGTPLTELELDDINSNHPDIVYDAVFDHLY